MPSNYAQICQENTREYGAGTRHLAFLGRLYTDRTHFIFELLQNAEDAEATKVGFALFRDHLEMRHDGRPFNEKDVRGICGVAESTKAEDLNQIGKFGIGFKSVYAYTSSPEIHSIGGPNGFEHFCIEHYVRPRGCSTKAPGEGWSTLLVFPFNNENVEPEKAFEEINKCLQTLSVRTLLFLRNIEDIEYRIKDGANGAYVRETKDLKLARQITVLGKTSNKEENEEWLVFQRPVQISDQQGTVYVEIAFQLVVNEKIGRRVIEKIQRSTLTVFFETDKETKLGFLIQGPYRTTPARDNIPSADSWNKLLVQETARLVAETLPLLKRMNLLSIRVLEAMPIRGSDFLPGSMFRAIFDAVQGVLSTQPLLPTDGDECITAHQAKLARSSELRKLLTPVQLQQLYSSENLFYWLSGEITLDRTLDLHAYITGTLKIEEVTPAKFAQQINESYLKQQDDKWVIQFYDFLLPLRDLWKHGNLRNKPIVRLQDGRHVVPFDMFGDKPNAFLPNQASGNFPTVKASIAADKNAAVFLKALGLHEVDERAVIEKIIHDQYKTGKKIPTTATHLEHIKMFSIWYKTHQMIDPFRGHDFLFIDKAEKYIRLPSEFYLDLPFCETGLSAIYESGLELMDKKSTLLERYCQIDGFVDFAKAIGVMDDVKVINSPISLNPDHHELTVDNWHAKRSSRGIELDYTVPNLELLLTSQNIPISLVIWKFLSRINPQILRASYRPNAQISLKTVDSLLVHTLRNHRWIPDRNGNFHTPQDISQQELHPAFLYDDRNGWLTAVGFGSKAKQQGNAELTQIFAKVLGIQDPRILTLLQEVQNSPELISEVENLVAQKRKQTVFPERKIHNPERRNEKVVTDLANAPQKQYEPRERRVRISTPIIDPSIWLYQQYTNDADEMVCQLCQNEMPFKKRNGEYYFEAIEIFSETPSGTEHHARFLALCPLCAAMYKEFVKKDENTSAKLKIELLSNAKNPIILQLGDKLSELRFVETHWHDLITILRE